tara:strand:+ start:308 stop:1039 length:732 start_codon:yes stop_codon:yes gene_type:complete
MPANMKKAGKKYMYGGMKKKKMSKGGSLKPVPSGNKGKGLSKLPKAVRNKMGYKQAGGERIGDLMRKKSGNTRQDSVRATLFQNNPNLHNQLDNSSRSHMFYNKLKEASKKVGPLNQKTRDRIMKEEEAKMMYGGSKIKKMKPYMYGGKKVPGMFEDDRMMYGGMKKKRMQYGVETTTEDEARRKKDQDQMANVAAESKSKKAPNWNKKLTRLTDKRRDRKSKGKSTKRVQKRINKEMKRIGN